ncbi:MAG: hypothetical protein SNJ72_00605 [Fimbriimonadales bacterium]
MVWLSLFLWGNTVHSLMHSPLHGEGDCMVCVVHKVPTLADAPIRQAVAVSSLLYQQAPSLHEYAALIALPSVCFQPLIPRAPPV